MGALMTWAIRWIWLNIFIGRQAGKDADATCTSPGCKEASRMQQKLFMRQHTKRKPEELMKQIPCFFKLKTPIMLLLRENGTAVVSSAPAVGFPN